MQRVIRRIGNADAFSFLMLVSGAGQGYAKEGAICGLHEECTIAARGAMGVIVGDGDVFADPSGG